MKHTKYIGVGINRVDGKSKVTGQAQYACDIEMPDMCYGKILFSAHPRAQVLKIDAGHAEAVDGVVKVITAKDIGGMGLHGYNIPHRPALVPKGEEVRFLGDPVALLVAKTQEIADRAIKLISVNYKVLSPICSPEEGLTKGAYQIHKGVKQNIASEHNLDHGDVDSGFEEAELIIEHTFSVPRQEQAFMETEAGVAYMDEKGRLHIYTGTQDIYDNAEDIHLALGIPKSKIHVRATTSGGAFGGKLNTTMQVQLAAMAYFTNVPVKLVLDREESFILHPKRHPQKIWMKLGANKDGKFVAFDIKVLSDAGPYIGRTHEIMGVTLTGFVGTYSFPNVRVKVTAVHTNNIDCGAFRGFGAPQAALAREVIIDKLARVLKMNQLEIKRKNFLKDNEKVLSPVLRSEKIVTFNRLADIAVEMIGPLPENKNGKKYGRSFCFDMPVFDVSAIPVLEKSGVGITVELFSDASAAVYAGGVDLGQGITTVLAQIAAEELALKIEDISVDLADTWTCPRSGRTSASRLTYVLGNALLIATAKIRETVFKRAAIELETEKNKLYLQDGMVKVRESLKQVSIKKTAWDCSNEGYQLREDGWFKYPENRYLYGHTFMGTVADVEVDELLGEVKVLKIMNVHDAGKVINPVLARGQLFGGSIQALGYALTEEMPVKDGKLLTSSFAQYLIPTSLDIPEEVDADFVEEPYDTGPYGAKGLGEHSLNSTTPAIVNAICNALNIDLNSIPVRSENIIRALKKK